MNVDYRGKDAVISAMKQSGLKKFRIQRPGAQKNATPVFECYTATSNNDVVSKFESWAAVIENNNPYEMVMFDNEDTLSDDSGKRKGKSMRFTFSLGTYSNVQPAAVMSGANNISTDQLVEAVAKKLQENQILNALGAINERLDAIEDGDDNDEEEEEEDAGFDPHKAMMAFNMMLDKIQKMRETPTKAALAGADEKENEKEKQPGENNASKISDEDRGRLNKALNVLRQNDPDFISNLEKLSKLAAKNKKTYKMAVEYLNAM